MHDNWWLLNLGLIALLCVLLVFFVQGGKRTRWIMYAAMVVLLAVGLVL